MERPLYINWLVNEEGVTFEDGVALKCYKLSYETDEAVFDDWALHIRKHYVEDDELTDDSVATGLSIEDYLREFPHSQGTVPRPSFPADLHRCPDTVRHSAGPHEPICKERLAGRAGAGVYHLHRPGSAGIPLLRRAQGGQAVPGTGGHRPHRA